MINKSSVRSKNLDKFNQCIELRRQGADLKRIKKFWSNILMIPEDEIRLSWKKNIVRHRRNNPEYLGQFSVEVQKVRFLYFLYVI